MLFAKTFADALHAKFVYAEKYFAAYKSENRRAAMKKIIPLAEDYLIKLDLFAQMMREMWFSHNKPFGFETIQIRLAGQLARTEEAIKRIQEVADGEADVIPETEDLFKIQDDVYTTFISWARASHGTTIV